MKSHADSLAGALQDAKDDADASKQLVGGYAQELANLKHRVSLYEQEVAELREQLAVSKMETRLLPRASPARLPLSTGNASPSLAHASPSTGLAAAPPPPPPPPPVLPSAWPSVAANSSPPSGQQAWGVMVEELEADRVSARGELTRIDSEINDLQTSLRELTSNLHS